MTTFHLPHISVVNESTVVSDADVQDMVNAVQRQVTNHFRPAWGDSAGVMFYPGGIDSVPLTQSHVWPCYIRDNSDIQGAGGYHDDNSGRPLLYVFAKDTLDAGGHVSVTLSHEVLETLADPQCQWSVGPLDTKKTFYALEVCDTCENDSFGYIINLPNGHPVLVSDFATPSWFTADPGPYDYMGHISAPLELLPGGYIGAWDPTHGWYQRIADENAPTSHRIAERAYLNNQEGDIERIVEEG